MLKPWVFFGIANKIGHATGKKDFLLLPGSETASVVGREAVYLSSAVAYATYVRFILQYHGFERKSQS